MNLQLQLTAICSLASLCLAHYGHNNPSPQPGESCTPRYTPFPCGKRKLLGEPFTETMTRADGFMGPNVCRTTMVYEVPTYSYSYQRPPCYGFWGYRQSCKNQLFCYSTGVCNGTVYKTTKKTITCCDGFTTSDGRLRTNTVKREGCPVLVRDNIVQCLEDLELTFFVDELTNLDDTSFTDELQNNDSDVRVTVFAWPNEAIFDDGFDEINSSKIIEGHTANGRITRRNLSKGKVIATRADDVALHVGTIKTRGNPSKDLFVNGVKITDVDACKTRNGNGIVHIVDSFIPFSENTITQVLESQPEHFSTFNRLLEAVNVMRYLRRSSTVFAPTNEAFNKLPSGAVECLLIRSNRKHLKTLVLVHIASPAEYSSTLVERSRVHTLSRYRLIISTDNMNGTILVTRNQIPIQEADIPANNGVIHVLPDVIVPPQIDFVKLCPTVVTTLSPAVPDATTASTSIVPASGR